MRAPSKAQTSLMRRYSSSLAHLRVRNSTIAGRPEKNSARLRQALSAVYASDTRSGSREFQASSAARAFSAAVSRVNGGNGRRPCGVFIERNAEILGEREHEGARRIGDAVWLQATQRHGVIRQTARLEGRTLPEAGDYGPLVEGVLHEQLQSPAFVFKARGKVDDAEGRLFAQQF